MHAERRGPVADTICSPVVAATGAAAAIATTAAEAASAAAAACVGASPSVPALARAFARTACGFVVAPAAACRCRYWQASARPVARVAVLALL